MVDHGQVFNRLEIGQLWVPKLDESIRDQFSDTPTLAHRLGGHLGLCSLKKAVPDIGGGFLVVLSLLLN